MKRNYFNLHSLRRACLTGALVLTAMVASAQSTVIKGNVKDATGEPVIGATVKIQGETKTGSITDIDGNLRLQFPRPKQRSRSLIWAQRHRLFPLKEKLL